MPHRVSSMEASSPPVEVDSTAATRRKSGRVSKKPDAYSPNAATKRKRAGALDGAEDGDAGDASEPESESSEGEPDEEELRESKKRARKQKSSARPQKKPKVNGETVRLPVRPAGKTKRPKKAKPLKDAKAAEEAGGLYGMRTRALSL